MTEAQLDLFDGVHDPVQVYVDHADGDSTLIIKQGDDRVHIDLLAVPGLVIRTKKAAGIDYVLPAETGGKHAKRA